MGDATLILVPAIAFVAGAVASGIVAHNRHPVAALVMAATAAILCGTLILIGNGMHGWDGLGPIVIGALFGVAAAGGAIGTLIGWLASPARGAV